MAVSRKKLAAIGCEGLLTGGALSQATQMLADLYDDVLETARAGRANLEALLGEVVVTTAETVMGAAT